MNAKQTTVLEQRESRAMDRGMSGMFESLRQSWIGSRGCGTVLLYNKEH